jgi:acyl-CoA synthetase (AMP-forming)/AMP-acid ligase II
VITIIVVRPTTIPEAVAAAAEQFGDDQALVDGSRQWTFRELAAAADRTARALRASGMRPGDRVAIWAPNMAEWPIVALGTYLAGCTVVPINTRFKGPEARHVLTTSGARILFTVTDFLDTSYLTTLGPPPPSLQESVVLSGGFDETATGWEELLARGDGDTEERPTVGPEDISDILFTSGTTGAPKGAMLRHGASVRAYTAWSDVVGLRRGDRYLIINPFFHAFGLKAGILACVLKGSTIIPHPVFDVPSVMRRVAEERVTVLPGPPAIYQTILDHPDLADHDLSTLRLAVTGAATVPVQMIRRMRSELTFETIVTGYGLTESTGITTMCRHDDDPETIARTAGRAIPDIEVEVMDEDGELLDADEPGEVVVRGYTVMAGFYGDAEATAEAIDADGWLHTGDVGVLDERGNLRITDRLKDMFIVGGFNAYPAEIEGTILRNPDVGQVAVVGIPDPRMGEVGKAFVVPRLGATIDPDALIEWCRLEMANYKVPRAVQVVDALPLNASGKVLKYVLRAEA